MKKQILHTLIAAMLLLVSNVTNGQAPTLGTAANFVLFTTNGAMTNSGIAHLTHLTGNVGSNLAGSVTGFGNVDGQMHTADAVAGVCASDVLLLYGQLAAATPTFSPSSPLLGNGATLVPGVYQYPLLTAASLNLDLILDGQGDPNSLFIIKIGGAFSTNPSAKVKLINGALACNVFWQVEGMVTMASGTTMRGNIVAHNGAISMSTLDTLEGRALSINGAVNTNSIMAYTPLGCGSAVLTGPAAPALASTAAYGVFSSIGSVTSTPVTYVLGDVGSNSTTTTGFVTSNVTGMIHTPPDASTAAAAADLTNVYNYLVALPTDIELLDPSNFGYGLVLTPHTYHLTAPLPITLNNLVYLNAEGNPNAVFVINLDGAFITSTLSKVVLMNGTQAKNVYWKIDGATHIFDNSVFNGTIVGAGAITLNTGDTLRGRVMTINGAVAINGSYIGTTPAPCFAAPITGTLNICTGTTTTLSDTSSGGTWSSSNPAVATINTFTGVATGILGGTSTIDYITPTGCLSTAVLTVNTTPSVITGLGSVCIGSTITLSDIVPGGTWSSSNPAQATVGSASGIVTGISSGAPTISYSTGGTCTATKTIVVGANAGTISGPSEVCVGSSIILTENVAGGTWSTTNSTATVLGGVVTGIANGVDTIKYTFSNICGTAVTSKTITVNAAPNAGVISGPSSVCVGSSIVLTNGIAGGIWSSSNATASVISGTVTGVTAGTDTIMYTVFNVSCSATASKTVTVNPLANAGAITGPSSVCVGSAITLSDIVTGGTWSATNGTATVLAGVVTGIANGVDTIKYTVTSVCGTAVASKTIAVNALPNAGVISGPSSVCVAATITLTDGVAGGIWSSSNGTATVVGGTVTGVSGGTDTINYTVFNASCNATATKIITITPLANAGTITGPANVCVGSSITLTDAVPGGTWSSSSTIATVIGGVVTGVVAGIDTIRYAVSNVCGTTFATQIIGVNAMPNAGVISGPGSICTGSSMILTDAAGGGVWSSSNANATVTAAGGVVTGFTTGIDTIMYTVSTINCSSTATKIITVITLPDAGFIIGPLSLCTGSSLSFIDVAPGGVWSSSNASASITSGGVATGVSPGADTIRYAVTNTCGTTTVSKAFTVNATPNAGSISGPSLVCSGMSIVLTESVTGGAWSSTNGNAAVSGGLVTGVAAGVDTIMYIVSTTTCSAAASKIITIAPAISAGAITGAQNVCTGSSITLANVATGGVWSATNGSATLIGGVLTGVSAGVDTIAYTVTAACGIVRSIRTVTVNPVPVAQIITTHPAAAACMGTMYQNFGAANLPLANTTYNWTATNAIVWAQGDFGQYALVNFTTGGVATVTLNTIMLGTGCSSQNSVTVAVSTTVAETPVVNYFNRHFIASPNNENAYQWGYDNVATLDSGILRGEINQDYLNATPDFVHNSYWVMTTMGGCTQKTYYKAPTTVQNVSDNGPAIEVYPNPANDLINVVVGSAIQGAIKIAIVNMTGQQVNLADAINNRAAINVATLSAGSYLISVYSDGDKIASARFIKN